MTGKMCLFETKTCVQFLTSQHTQEKQNLVTLQKGFQDYVIRWKVFETHEDLGSIYHPFLILKGITVDLHILRNEKAKHIEQNDPWVYINKTSLYVVTLYRYVPGYI